MGAEVSHPFFARAFDRLSRLMERDVGRYRHELVAGLHGRVIEVGAGNGLNFAHYPSAVEEVVALEPEPYLRERAEQAAREAAVPVTLLDGVAFELPFEDGSFEGAVVSLVLCSVHDQQRALAELRRVLRSGAELRFFEHVRADTPGKARLQTAIDRSGAWARLAGGCHLARETHAAIERAGFRTERLSRHDVGPTWMVSNPHVLGRVRAV